MYVIVKQTEALRTLCLYFIVENFDRFMYAYKSGNYELKYLFGLLQKENRISIPLLEKLLHTDKFQKYMDFLLNPYIKEIDLDFTVADVMPILERLKQIAPTITSLDLPWLDYEHTSLPELVSLLTEVETLSLRGITFSIETFRCIGKNCRNLKSLAVDNLNITDMICMEALVAENSDNKCNLSERLEYLYFSNFSAEGLKYAIKNFRGLLHLDDPYLYHYAYELHESDINNDSKITEIYKLQKLEVIHINSRPAKFLKFCGKLFPYLKVLSVGYITSQAYVDALKALPSLKEISLNVHDSCNLNSYLQEKGGELKTLKIIHGTISLNSLLNSCPKVNSLKLNSPTIINDTLASKCSLTHCKNLDLSLDFGYDPNKQFVKFLLSRCPNVENLFLQNDCGDENRALNVNYVELLIASGKWIKNLRRLHCAYSKMEMTTVQHFVENAPNLKIIVLGIDQLTVNDIEYLKCLRPSIIYLDVWLTGWRSF